MESNQFSLIYTEKAVVSASLEGEPQSYDHQPESEPQNINSAAQSQKVPEQTS